MLFLTRQPASVAQILKDKDYLAAPDNDKTNGMGVGNSPIVLKFGYQPIFVTPMTDKVDFIIRYLISSASLPETNIIFTSEAYDRISASAWYSYLGRPKSRPNLHCGQTDIEEYIVPIIKQKDVVLVFDTPPIVKDLKQSSSQMLATPALWKKIDSFFCDKRDIMRLIASAEFGCALDNFWKNMNFYNQNPKQPMPYNRVVGDFRSSLIAISDELFK